MGKTFARGAVWWAEMGVRPRTLPLYFSAGGGGRQEKSPGEAGLWRKRSKFLFPDGDGLKEVAVDDDVEGTALEFCEGLGDGEA